MKRIFVIVASLWAIIAQTIRLATWYLPYPHDILLLIWLIDNSFMVHLINMGSCIAIGLIALFLWQNIIVKTKREGDE